MSNPFNPLDWLRAAQDWFARTERSSGFRPYLIFLIIVAGISITLLTAWGHIPGVRETALVILSISVGGFIVLYGVKAFQDPDFCRSETHVARMRRLEVETMGSESHVVSAEVIEQATEVGAPPLQRRLPGGEDSSGQG